VIAVDCGNTRTTLARVEGGEVRGFARLPSQPGALRRALPHLVERLTSGHMNQGGGSLIGLSCVVPALMPIFREILSPWGEPVPVAPENLPRMSIGYHDPHELGPDRLANAVGARSRLGEPCLVVDLGTALTLDLVDAGGGFAGGVIFPGMETARAGLMGNTARVSGGGAATPRLLGRSTAEGVAGGLAYGFQAVIEGLIDRFREEVGGTLPAVLTGGGAAGLPERPRGVTLYSPFLTLEGIGRVVEEGA
jgi:type III pantothenate kinase